MDPIVTSLLTTLAPSHQLFLMVVSIADLDKFYPVEIALIALLEIVLDAILKIRDNVMSATMDFM